MKEENQFEVPFQVQTLIATLRDKTERVHVRGNYRQRLDAIRTAIDKALADYDTERLDAIRTAIDKALADYDTEMGTTGTPKYKKVR